MSIRIAWLKIACSSPRVVIGEGAQVEYAILDKGVEVELGVVIRGTAEHPVVVKKGAKVTEDIHS